MKHTEIARNYGEALYHVGREADILDEIEATGERLTAWMRETPLRAVWHSPLVPKAEKIALARTLLEGEPLYLVNFVCLLLERNRIDYLPDIFEEFLKIRDRESHTLDVVLETPLPLSPTQLNKVRQRLSELSDREVHLRVREAPQLIGGIRLKIHDKLLDGSVLARLEGLRQQLLAQTPSG